MPHNMAFPDEVNAMNAFLGVARVSFLMLGRETSMAEIDRVFRSQQRYRDLILPGECYVRLARSRRMISMVRWTDRIMCRMRARAIDRCVWYVTGQAEI
jgi:hypothetical protein